MKNKILRIRGEDYLAFLKNKTFGWISWENVHASCKMDKNIQLLIVTTHSVLKYVPKFQASSCKWDKLEWAELNQAEAVRLHMYAKLRFQV